MIAECQEGILLLARGDGSRPDGSFFLHRMTGEHELPQAGSPLTDGRYSLEIKRRVALCGARESAAPAAGAKRKGHLRFPFLFELLPFPYLLARRKSESGDRSEKEYGRGFFLCCGRTTFGVRPLEQPVRSVGYHSATHVVSSPQGAALSCRACVEQPVCVAVRHL